MAIWRWVHQHLPVSFAQLLQPVEEGLRIVCNLPQLVAQKEFQIDQHLIVPRAARVDLFSGVAQPAGKHQLDLRVDILRVGFDFEASGLDLGGNLLQSGRQRTELLGGQQADFFEHGDMGQRPLDVVAGELQVQIAVVADGILFDHLVGFETLVPKFGGAHAYRMANCSMYFS